MERADAFNYVLNFHLWTTKPTELWNSSPDVAQHRSGALSLPGAAMLPAFRKHCTERGGLRPLYKRAISSQIFSCGGLCRFCAHVHTQAKTTGDTGAVELNSPAHYSHYSVRIRGYCPEIVLTETPALVTEKHRFGQF